MKINPYFKYRYLGIFFFIQGIFLLNLFTGCSSSETPSQTGEGQSEVFGTVFEKPLEYSAGENPVDLSFGDFNGDNKTDFIVTSPRKQEGFSTTEDGTMVIFQNNSSSNNSFPYTASFITPTTAEWRQDVISADFTGDNNTDLIVTHTDKNSIKLLRNNGAASFTDNGSVSVGNIPLDLVSGDWNNDNQTDIAVVNRDNSSISILQNGSGIFSVSQNLIVNELPIRVTSGDWDNDTYLDLAVLSRNGNLVQILINSGGGSFNISNTTYNVGRLPHDLISGDWNCDSKLDLAVSNYGDNTLSLIYGNGNGNFNLPIVINSGRGPGTLAAADFDNDSKMDFVVGHRFYVSTSGVSLLTGDFSLTLSDSNYQNGYSPSISFAAGLTKEGSYPAELAILDLNSDSKLDLLITLPISKKLVFLSGKQYFGNLSCP